jgi:phosphoglycolate phosphatase
MPGALALEAVVFDLDGVLVDSRPAITAGIAHALEVHGLPTVPYEEVNTYIGPPLRDAFVAILADRGGDVTLADECVHTFRRYYRDHCAEGTVMQPGVDEALLALSEVLPLAVATSKPEEFALTILEHLDLARFFTAVAGPSLDPDGEDKAVTLRRALDGLESILGRALDPRACIIVGDRHHDVDAARAVGIRTVGVTWGFGDDDELAAAEHLVRSPDELLALLRVGRLSR